MSNLREFLLKRRGRFYEGEALSDSVEAFLSMVGRQGVEVHETPDAIVVLEPYGVIGCMRGWLLFDKFTRGTVRTMAQVTEGFQGRALYASTHDPRIKDLLTGLGFVEYQRDATDFYLVKRRG